MGISEAINSFAMAMFPVVAAVLYDIFGFNLYLFFSAFPAIGLFLAIQTLRKVGVKAFV